MNGLLGFVGSYLGNAVWEVVLIAAMAWLMSRLIRRLGPQAEHAVWVVALMMALLTPALPALGGVLESWMGLQRNGGSVAVVFAAGGDAATAHGGTLALPAVWMGWLLGCYAAVLVLFAGRLALRICAAVRMLRKDSPAALTAEQDRIWRDCARAFGLKGVRILACAEIAGPAAIGLRMPTLLLPSDFARECAAQDFLAAVAHECAHLKRRDFQKNLFYEIASLVLAFHPLTAMMKTRIAQTREMVCDGMVTEGHVESRDYARSLLRLATMVAVEARASGSYAVGIFDGAVLEERIRRIGMKKKRAGVVVRYGLMISAAAVLLSTVVGAAAMAVPIVSRAGTGDEAQSGAASSTHAAAHVYKVGHGVSAPVPLNVVEAEFPKAARNDKKLVDGIVVVGIVVDAEGMPQDVHVVRSFRADFDAEAVKAVKRYRFKPAMLSGKPVAASVKIEVRFKRY